MLYIHNLYDICLHYLNRLNYSNSANVVLIFGKAIHPHDSQVWGTMAFPYMKVRLHVNSLFLLY
jgi:hypothetical protein